MSSYLPPNRYDNKDHFNSTEFQSSLSASEIETKLKTTLSSNVSKYIDSGINTDDTDDATQAFNVTFTDVPVVVCTCTNTSTGALRSIHLTEVRADGFDFKKKKLGNDDASEIVTNDSGSQFHWIAIGSVAN